jgi:hypothetical protein
MLLPVTPLVANGTGIFTVRKEVKSDAKLVTPKKTWIAKQCHL